MPAESELAPEGMPPIAFTYECDGQTSMSAFGEEHPIPYPNASTAFPSNFTKTLRRGYYAAVSFVDFLVGEMMSELERLGLGDDTVIALVGDHGWQLGEHNIWGKHTNFELGTRVPLLIRDPTQKGGLRTQQLVESVDIYPTVARIAGLPMPDDVDGTDLSPLWKAPEQPVKPAAFSEYPRCPQDWRKPWEDTTSCVHTDRAKFTSMGYSVRDPNFRYTIWLPWDGDKLVGDFSAKQNYGVELYTHKGDDGTNFDTFENVNVASDPQYADDVKRLHAMAVAHWSK